MEPSHNTAPSAPLRFETHPRRYQHWKLSFGDGGLTRSALPPPKPPGDGAIAWLVMDVQQDKPQRPGYELKLNSYDIGVDVELADAVMRLRFEHPEVKVVVVTS